MVEPECLTKAWNITARQILLPINPPEINTLLLAHSHQVLKERPIKSRILQLPRNSCNTRIKPHVISYIRKVVIAGANAVSRVEVKSCSSVMSMHPIQKSCRIREQRFVPCPACPGVLMPITVNHQNIMRHIQRFHVAKKLLDVCLFICLILAIPIAKHELWGKRLTACDADIISKSIFILMPVTKEIPVNGIRVKRFSYPGDAVNFIFERERTTSIATLCTGRFVENRPTVARK